VEITKVEISGEGAIKNDPTPSHEKCRLHLAILSFTLAVNN
jgi:hypothetical protein